jgi:hypothetical protein
MQKNRSLSDKEINIKIGFFNRVIDLAKNKIFSDKKGEKLSNVVFESILYGIAKNIDHLESCTNHEVKTYYREILKDQAFSKESIREGLYQKNKLLNRLDVSNKIFSGK